jgi:hypothetical protein
MTSFSSKLKLSRLRNVRTVIAQYPIFSSLFNLNMFYVTTFYYKHEAKLVNASVYYETGQ